MAELRVSELPTAVTLDDSDLLLLSQPDANSDTGYASAKTTNVALATKIAKNTSFGDLATTSKKLIGAINELKGEVGAQDLADLDDVNVTTPAAGECLQYNGTSQKWENKDILAVNETTLTEPYVYKQVPNGKYTEKLKKLIGASVVWNQLVDTSTISVTITSGHKYIHWNGSTLTKATSDGSAISVTGGTDKIYDLTVMFGNDTVATAITTDKFSELFPDYASYAYSANTIQSVSVSGHKIGGTIYFNGDLPSPSGSIKYYPIYVGDKSVTLVTDAPAPSSTAMLFLLAGNVSSGAVTNTNGVWKDHNITQTAENGYVTIGYRNVTTYLVNDFNTILRDLNDFHTTALDHTTLRGIFKLDANNNLYADGDIYNADGSGSVKYAIVDLGSLDWGMISVTQGTMFRTTSISDISQVANSLNLLCPNYITTTPNDRADKTISKSTGLNVDIIDNSYSTAAAFKTAMSGVKLIYELATPTTAALTPFNPLSTIEQGGTEEFVDYGVEQSTRDVAIPPGNESAYGDNKLMGEIIKYINN